MKKRLISLIVAVVMLFSMLCPAAYADDETVSFDTCTHEWETPLRSGYSITIPGSDVSFSVKTEQCKKCKWYKHVATIFIAEFTYYSPLNVDANGLVPTELATYWANVWYNNFGKNATATKFTPGGGSTSGGGVGRRPDGYADDNGTPTVSHDGELICYSSEAYISSQSGQYGGVYDHQETKYHVSKGGLLNWFGRFVFVAPVSGYYYAYVEDMDTSVSKLTTSTDSGEFKISTPTLDTLTNTVTGSSVTLKTDISKICVYASKGDKLLLSTKSSSIAEDAVFYVYSAPIRVVADDKPVKKNSITFNNNTWNGNIYVDNSNNLTYIYPQYTTINEKNETVTNISNNPIIYNNETYQYYTYDSVTNNYYYITYPGQPTPPPPTATPSPSPSPSPSENDRPVSDMYYRWVITERRGTDDGGYNAIQVSELEFYDKDKNLISWPSDVSIKSSLDTSWNEPITNLVDNKINNKWGCNRWGSGKTGKCVIDIYAPNMQIPSYYGYVTGSDMPARDPVSWKLYYSFDGLKYYEASTMEQATNIPTGRNAKTEKWPFNYQSPTPSPSPTPAPTDPPSPSPAPDPGKPGGDTTGILAVLVEIRDNMIQGFLDIKAAFVAGFAELSANFTLAIENLNVNIQNIFNKKFPDQSTPETALPSPSPSPSPAPTDPPLPSPAPDPGKPDSGDKTNNFWTIIFPNGGGSEDGKKGIFWALVSLILALIAFFANLAVGVGYLFPFLPDGVVMTINTCLIVIFLFTIIKFIMRSK